MLELAVSIELEACMLSWLGGGGCLSALELA